MAESGEPKKDFLTVGIGASAGGLSVLKTVLRSVPGRCGMAFVVVQHLDPTHESMLSELLDRDSALPVKNAEQGQQVEAEHVYVIPPDTYLEVCDGVLRLTEPTDRRGFRRSIDHFFCSLARDCGDRCAAIVLSGSGSDGTAGLRAVKASGGLTLAQDPQTAEHLSMPQSAIDAAVVDKVAAPEQLFEVLQRFSEQAFTRRSEPSGTSAFQRLERVAAILKSQSNFNLNQYKPSTVQRRIARRMSLTNTPEYGDYLDKLRNDAEERQQLTNDLLINVTDFFRDRQAFDLVEKQIFPELVDGLSENEDLRIWVAGCATGEEAYSLAMVALESLAAHRRKNSVKIFATDVDEHAIKSARRAVYPERIAADVPQHYLERYFTRVSNDHHYRVKEYLRNLISFAVHNVVTDPPFNHMHLISCRNLLIYLRREAQDRVLRGLYFALEPQGSLFLGSAETISTGDDLFKTLSKKWRIYRKIPGHEARATHLRHLDTADRWSSPDELLLPAPRQHREPEVPSRADQMRSAILSAFLPPTVIVDREGQILYNHGDWKPYMEIPTGEARNDIVRLVLPALRSRLRSALYSAHRNQQAVAFHCGVPDQAGKPNGERVVRVQVAPLPDQAFADGPTFGIVFQDSDSGYSHDQPERMEDDPQRECQDLEQELTEAREELQNTIEELETSTEELKAAHEEALSTNEELQSANEELEASSEELRSLNEELSTVNVQLKEKIEELQKANSDIENFVASTDVPTLFLDPDLRIQRATPAAERLLHLRARDHNAPLSNVRHRLLSNDLLAECRRVLETFQPASTEAQADGRWYIRRVTPYRTGLRQVNGVVVLLQDVTEIKELSRRAQGRERQQAVVAQLGLAALSDTKPETLIERAVRQVAHTLEVDYAKVLHYRPEQNDFLLVAGVGWDRGMVGRATVPGGVDSQAGYTLTTNEPVLVQDLNTERRFSAPALLQNHQVTSGISCAINHSQPPFGVISVHTRHQRTFTADDANFVLSVANLLSAALRTWDTQARLGRSETQFRTIANSIPQLAWMTDQSGAMVWFNQRWYDYTGTRQDEVKGWGWTKVHHPEHVDRVVELIKHTFDSGEEWEDVFPLRGKNSDYRWFLSRAKPIRNESDTVVQWFGTHTDVTDQLEQERALRESEQTLRIAKDSNKFGVFEYDIRTRALTWDPLLLEIWGLESDEAITLDTFFEGLHPEDRQHTQRALERSLAPDGLGHYHAVYRVLNRKTGAQSWVEASGEVLFDGDQPQRMIGMIIDITEKKELELSLKSAVHRLEEEDEKKNRFLAVLGHELRNPLATLSALLKAVELGLREPGEVVPNMLHSVGTMSRLLDDLLDLTRIGRGIITLGREPVDLALVLEQAIQSQGEICKGHGQTLVRNIDSPLPMKGDPTRIEQVFSNLLGNACKFTPAGGTIEVSAARDGNGLVARIVDEGVGIEPANLEQIFEPFFQDRTLASEGDGLGIGLALARSLVELQDGTIRAFSKGKNQGATFEVRFPAASEANPQSVKQAESATETVGQITAGLPVLVVDDATDLLEASALLLQSLGCTVRTAATGLRGLELALEHNPRVVFVDIGLPDIEGYEVAERLRDGGFEHLLVALSGYGHEEARQRAEDAGFDLHVAKPASLETIVRILGQVN